MKEQKKETEELNNNAEANEASEDSGQNRQSIPTRSMVVWALAGVYLIYTGRNLCKNVLDGAEGAGRGFFVAGVVFLILGFGLILLSLKSYWVKAKADREKQETSAGTEPSRAVTQQGEEVKQGGTSGRRMTIAERARLTSRLAEEEEQTEEEAQAETEEPIETEEEKGIN